MTEREIYQPSPAWQHHYQSALPPTPPSAQHPGGHHMGPSNSPMGPYGGPHMSQQMGYSYPPMYGYQGQPGSMPHGGHPYGMSMQSGPPLVHHQGPMLAPMGPLPPAPSSSNQQATLIYVPDRHYVQLYPMNQNSGQQSGGHGGQGVPRQPEQLPYSGGSLMMGPPQAPQQMPAPYGDEGHGYMRGPQGPYPPASNIHHLVPSQQHHHNLPPQVAPYIPANRSGSDGELAVNTNTNQGTAGGDLHSASTGTATIGSPCREAAGPFRGSPTRTASNKNKGAKRPANSWILYRQEKHPIVLAQNEGISNNEISKVVAEWWKKEPDEVKNVYKSRAEEERRRHRLLHPDYKYAPRKNKPRRKKRKSDAGHDRDGSGDSEEEQPAIARATSADHWYAPGKGSEDFKDGRRYSQASAASSSRHWIDSDSQISQSTVPSRRASFADFCNMLGNDPTHTPHGSSMPNLTNHSYDSGLNHVQPEQGFLENQDFTFLSLGFDRFGDDTLDAAGSDAECLTVDDILLVEGPSKDKLQSSDQQRVTRIKQPELSNSNERLAD
ncbi:hypothetical protein DFJ77DRAFT_443834 [Powellomyces hirtus]|nr:hypothetical protein DFJ77DRAFT_443834 [Powellomyces hirtus]